MLAEKKEFPSDKKKLKLLDWPGSGRIWLYPSFFEKIIFLLC